MSKAHDKRPLQWVLKEILVYTNSHLGQSRKPRKIQHYYIFLPLSKCKKIENEINYANVDFIILTLA